jgi:hypothetical protein
VLERLFANLPSFQAISSPVMSGVSAYPGASKSGASYWITLAKMYLLHYAAADHQYKKDRSNGQKPAHERHAPVFPFGVSVTIEQSHCWRSTVFLLEPPSEKRKDQVLQ